MTPNPAPAPLAKRAAKLVLRGVGRVLPRPLYDAMYRPAFTLYRKALRAGYRRQIERQRRTGDNGAVVRGELVHKLMPWSLVGASGLERTYDLAMAAVERGLAGAFVECGVARGGSAALLVTVAAREGAGRHCFLFDSYEGLPDPTAEDFGDGDETGDHVRPLPRGSCLGTYDEVRDLLFRRLALDPDRVTMVKGWFQDTLPAAREGVGKIALLRLDGDWYDSTMCCLENLFDQVVAGGHVIIDDYHSCYGARRATDEFLARRGIRPELSPDGRGGCSFTVPGD